MIIILFFVFSYVIGCVMFGYVVTKVFYGEDIRDRGSRNVGARNAGRLHGKWAFFLIFLGDAFKGAAVILLARYFDFSDEIQLIGLGLAIIGHIKPVTLKFKGGKGISTFIGGILAFQPFLAFVIIIGFVLLYPFARSFTISGLGAFLFIPIVLYFYEHDWFTCVIISIILIILFLVHSENIKERLTKNGPKA